MANLSKNRGVPDLLILALAVLVALISAPGGTVRAVTTMLSTPDSDNNQFHGFDETSMQLDGSDYAVVAYHVNGNVNELRILHCGNAACDNGNAINTVDTSGGWSASLALDLGGNPVMAFHDGDPIHSVPGHLKILHCNDPACAGGDDAGTAVDTSGNVGFYTSLALDSAGNPTVSYVDRTNGALKLLHCNDPACVGGDESITTPDPGPDLGGGTSLALDASGNPVVAYEDTAAGMLKILHCNDSECAGNDDTINTTASGGRGASLALDSAGNPVVAHTGFGCSIYSCPVNILTCGDQNCVAQTDATIVAENSEVFGPLPLVLGPGDLPAFAYRTQPSLRIVRCGNTDCSSGNTVGALPEGNPNASFPAYPSLRLDALTRPVLAFTRGNPGGGSTLRFVRCANASCGNPTAYIEGSKSTSLQLDAAGNPVIAAWRYGSYPYAGYSKMLLIRCLDEYCISGYTTTTHDLGLGSSVSLELDSGGRPVVSYYSETAGDTVTPAQDLRVLRCGDPGCTTGNTIAMPDSAGDVGNYTSLALDSGDRPVVSYYDYTNGHLKLLHCGSVDCTTGNSITTPDTAAFTGLWTSLALDTSGYPVVSYYDSLNGDLKLLHCNDANCAPGGDSIQTVDTMGNTGKYTSLQLDAAGHPVISYQDATNANLKVAHCADANCAAGTVIASPETAGYVGSWTSVSLDSAGNPVVSYDATFNDTGLHLLHCGNVNCTSGNAITRLASAGLEGLYTSLALDGAGRPVISSIDGGLGGTSRTTVVHCLDANCLGSADFDGDGCADIREQQTSTGSEVTGGRRNAKNPNDYFDASHDGQVRINDIILVVQAYFKDDNDGNPGLPPYAPGYSSDTDRTFVGPNAWNLGPPNGLQRIDDVVNALHQYYHDCG